MTPGEPVASLEFRDVRKGFSGVPVLRGVSLAVEGGEVLGLVGENGAGKSTLMNLLGGVFPPDGGAMLLDGRVYAPASPRDAARAGVAFIHQELNLFPNLSVAENLLLDGLPRLGLAGLRLPLIDRRALRARVRPLLEAVGLDLDPDTAVGELPAGRRQLVEIARALGARARVLILDEPTTSLSAREADRLFALLRRLRERGVAMIFISHNLPDVLGLCDSIAVLRDGGLISHGPAAGYDEARLFREMVGRDAARQSPSPRADASGPILQLRDLARPPAVRGVSLDLRGGEVVGVAGLMGAGRTELLRLVFGLDRIESGSVLLDGKPLVPSPRRSIRAGLAFLTEDRREEGLLMDSAVVPNATLAALPGFARTPLRLVDRSRERTAAASAAEGVRLRAARIERQPVRTLSGGNQQKVVLARWLLTRPRVLLLDEPTRGVDVAAKQDIYQLVRELAAGGAGVLVVSSEIEELTTLCDRIAVMAAGRLVESLGRPEFDRERILRAAFRGEGRGEGAR
ncbi:Galactose/methyl galactoside import ATP-binding protein MglA [Aquisphaera giovannonii]|uniref:Galactose/methyl galactoside import ATP-binding protein MglA n=1 Tax=Aquisphaera giovannonii TaxID=406548 RepID=A0A5B9W5D0_9BACT|nr:sugar ABC transporter ATP-binding protein [Aquisphaera giovannonii]QEH35180.1 Galactose/methyl galactoside import ATP-binding protein MglA [Aquisphaera giovannonii]